jgi:hypothetical protein
MLSIIHGLLDHMVLQRNARDVSDAVFDGKCVSTGKVRVRVFKSGQPLKGWAGAIVGKALRRKFEGRLRGLPVGGPYDIELSIVPASGQATESLWISDVLVGDVWLLGGQSNMQGCGMLREALPPVPQVRAFFMDHHWRVAKEPIHNMDATVDEVHKVLNGGALPPRNTVTGTCPGPGFAQEMLKRTGVPQGLIAAAHGGTSMAQWDPAKRNEGGASLYGAMVGRLRKNGGKVAGLLWYQGESDANPDAVKVYTHAMIRFVRALRRDCGDKNLPVAIVQISRVTNWPADASRPWNSIQEQERRLPRRIKHLATVPAIDLTLADGIHISGRDQNRLGVRLAQAMDVLRRGNVAGKPPIEVGRIRMGFQPGRLDAGMVEVEFLNVVGQLRSGSRPSGLALGDGANPPGNLCDIQLKGNRALVYATLAPAGLAGLSLHYGAGTDPYCNITDEADRSLPVFGPMPLGQPKAVTPFWRVADVAFLAQPYERLGSRPPQNLRYQRHTYTTDFSDSRFIFPGWPKDNTVLVYRYRFSCVEAMKLELLLGYDGPITAWVDNKRVLCDPDGTNPAIADQHVMPFGARTGGHEVVIALGNQSGRAWGVWVRLARRDVAKAALLAGLTLTLPELRSV